MICDEAETLGVNSRADLARAEAAFQARARAEALEDGVTLAAPETVVFAWDTVVGRDVTVEPYVVFGPGVTVETGARIRAFSHLEGCHVGGGATASAPSPGCAPAPSWPRTSTSATSSRSRPPRSARAPRSTT